MTQLVNEPQRRCVVDEGGDRTDSHHNHDSERKLGVSQRREEPASNIRERTGALHAGRQHQ